MGFLKENKNRFLSDFDFSLFTETDQMEVFIDSVFNLFDTILTRGPDEFYKLVSIDDIPEEYINHLSAVVGWRQTDYNFNYLTFRDLVKNIVHIYKIKGTSLSYELFFRAIGYIPKLYELWWDEDGKLQRTKPYGAPNPLRPTNILNKSNYLEIEIDLILDDPDILNPFSDNAFLMIIVEYLRFLKPVHIRYKPILVNIPSIFLSPVLVDSIVPIIIIGEEPTPQGLPTTGRFEDVVLDEIIDDFAIYSLMQETECAPMYYNNTIYYGSSVARSVELDNVQFPVSVIQRQEVKYGGTCAPMPDELSIVIQTDKFIGEEKLTLQYNNYAYFDNQASFDTNQSIEIMDTTEFGSQQFGFGPGNVWTKP